MSPTNRSLRNLLAVQGAFYLAVNVWALVSTRHFLSYSNPEANLFEARSFAALCSILALYFLAGAWRADLQRPAAFLGLGSAVAIGLVELFHLPGLGWSLLWADLFAEVVIAAFYVNILFFHREPAVSDAAAVATATMATAAQPEEPQEADTPPEVPDMPEDTSVITSSPDPEREEKDLL